MTLSIIRNSKLAFYYYEAYEDVTIIPVSRHHTIKTYSEWR